MTIEIVEEGLQKIEKIAGRRAGDKLEDKDD